MLAQYAAVGSALLALVSCAAAALFAWKASRAASNLRSMTSLQGELVEIRDYLAKLDRWAKRINARESMTEIRARPGNERNVSSQRASDSKDELRRRAGLTAGIPARHNGRIDG